jgi:hypothetical protein
VIAASGLPFVDDPPHALTAIKSETATVRTLTGYGILPE